MSNLQFTTSDYISILALIVAILLGIANYIYTRRTFHASTYPLLNVTLDIRLEEINPVGRPRNLPQFFVTRLSVTLTNLSSNLSVQKAQIQIKVSQPSGGWRFWRKWLLYGSRETPSIGPTSNHTVTFDGSIEKWLDGNLSGIVEKTDLPGGYYYYSLHNPCPVELLISVKYWPGVSGAKFRDISVSYRLKPEPKAYEDLPKPGCYWKTEIHK